jgi:hypothetical protein
MKRSVKEQFIVDISHAFARYGIKPREGDTCNSLGDYLLRAITSNLHDIEELVVQLEFFIQRIPILRRSGLILSLSSREVATPGGLRGIGQCIGMICSSSRI